MDIPFGYPTMRVPGARIDWAQIVKILHETQDRRPKKMEYPPSLGIVIVGLALSLHVT